MDFYSDAYRVAANIGLDAEWFGPRTDERRYYDNCLYFFAVLSLSGKYRIY